MGVMEEFFFFNVGFLECRQNSERGMRGGSGLAGMKGLLFGIM